MTPEFRTRFAPSPTGFVHIGTVRTALYAYLAAKHNGGKIILRIEDTDQTREVPGAVECILRSFNWLGMKFDEGEGVGGPFGPYTQSQRLPLYREYAEKLVEAGQAYYCFCTAADLEKMREQQIALKLPPRYNGHCRNLPLAEAKKRVAAGEPYVIRLKVPESVVVEFDDVIRGHVAVASKEIDDQVLLKSDGFPTYQLAVVIDDHFMKITHVIRAEEWLSSTPKHILLYQFLGWEAPVHAHLPAVLKAKGVKLSKRHGDASLDDFIQHGYLPEAIINFVALQGWHPSEDNRELFTLEELGQVFDLERVQKAGAIFDTDKLDWMNAHYIRQKDIAELVKLIKPYIKDCSWYREDDVYLSKLVGEIQSRLTRLEEAPELLEFFYTAIPYDPGLFANEKMKLDLPLAKSALEAVWGVLSKVSEWTLENITAELQKVIAELGLKNGQVLWPVRLALSGKQFSPGAFEMAFFLGQEETLQRLKTGIAKLA